MLFGRLGALMALGSWQGLRPLRRWLTERIEAWVFDERLAALTLKWFPNSGFGHWLVARSYIRNGKPGVAADLLLRAPRNVRLKPSILLRLEKALRDAKDHVRAHSILLKARADHPAESEILIRLAYLSKTDGQLEHARALLLEAESLGCDESIRRLFIETALQDFAAGQESLRRAMKSRDHSLLQAAQAVNEFSVHYPELAPEVAQFREVVRDAVRSPSGALSPSERIELALLSRLVDEARLVHDDAVFRHLPLRNRARRIYGALNKFAEPVRALASLAWENERSDGRSFMALIDGRPVEIDSASYDPERTVEIFIPVAFYRRSALENKRQIFKVLADRVAQKHGVILVPRHQFSSRFFRPSLRGRTLSYHTRGEADRRHLRYKEGAFPGYFTVDHSGYAGFASVATDFDEIHRTVAHVSRDALHENRAALYAELVEKGRSKYFQPSTDAGIKGRYVFVALQVVMDEVAKLAWMPSIELMRDVAWLYRGTNIAVVVKRHPLCESYSVQAAMMELESQGMIIVSTASIHSLIANAEIVFTVNSGVGLEALVHGRPVVVSGLCDYAYAAACVHAADELEAAVANAQDAAVRGLEFLYYYTHRHAFKLSEVERLEQRVDEWLDRPLGADVAIDQADRRSTLSVNA